MSKTKLITPSLFSSIKFYQEGPESWREKAFNDLKDMLGRTSEWNPSPAVERGLKFEKTLEKILTSGKQNEVKVSPEFRVFLDLCEGGIWQKKTKTIMNIDGTEYCLYGKIDVDFPKSIIDIKTTGSIPWKGFEHKFLSSMQHKIYCHNEQKEKFLYLIAYFNDPKNGDAESLPISQKIYEVHKAHYVVESFDKLAEEIRDAIGGVNMFFEQYPELAELFHTKYSRY